MSENITDLPEWAQTLVRDLRSEAAGHRKAATEATTERDALRGQLHERAAAEALESVRSILVDPDDLARYVDAAELTDDNGAPDPARYKAQAELLVESKPHLAPRGKDFGSPVGGGRPVPRDDSADAQIQTGQSDFIQAVRGSW